MANQGQGWHGDPEGHAEAARQRDKFNWWPLLFIPLAFVIGWVGGDAVDNNEVAYNNEAQYGVGGAPYEPCVTPGMQGQ